jgi:hypothetical protein
MLGGDEQILEVAGGWEREIQWGRGICPTKLKTERDVLSIGLVLK